MQKILVSGCFLGAKVRYNAQIKPLLHPLLQRWQQQQRLIVVCPEVDGGLPVPRKAAERQQHSGLVINTANEDVSQAFYAGAQRALALCQHHQIRYALLKEASPSCGSTIIYDGSFSGKKIAGQGITTELLRQHGIEVFSELTIEALAQQLA